MEYPNEVMGWAEKLAALDEDVLEQINQSVKLLKHPNTIESATVRYELSQKAKDADLARDFEKKSNARDFAMQAAADRRAAAEKTLKSLEEAAKKHIKSGLLRENDQMIEGVVKQMSTLAADLPEATATAGAVAAEAQAEISRRKSMILGGVSETAKRYKVSLPDTVVNDVVQRGLAGDPQAGHDLRDQVRRMRGERFKEVKKLRAEKAVRRMVPSSAPASVMEGVESMIGKAGSVREIERIGAQQLPRMLEKAAFGKNLKIGGAAGLLGLLAVPAFQKLFGGSKEGGPQLTPQQQFQLSMAMAQNAQGAPDPNKEAMQFGRQLNNVQKILAIVKTLQDAQGMMVQPGNVGGLV